MLTFSKMALESLYKALLSSSFLLAALIVSRGKCIYRTTDDGCQPACACPGQPLQHQKEDIDSRRIELEGKEVAVLLKKA